MTTFDESLESLSRAIDAVCDAKDAQIATLTAEVERLRTERDAARKLYEDNARVAAKRFDDGTSALNAGILALTTEEHSDRDRLARLTTALRAAREALQRIDCEVWETAYVTGDCADGETHLTWSAINQARSALATLAAVEEEEPK